MGVIKPGAYADLLIVDGDPLKDMKVMIEHENNLKLIIKEGILCQNILCLLYTSPSPRDRS